MACAWRGRIIILQLAGRHVPAVGVFERINTANLLPVTKRVTVLTRHATHVRQYVRESPGHVAHKTSAAECWQLSART